MNFSTSFLDEIRARLSVSDVVGRRVKLTKRGREFVGLSPFNPEKTPSFTVNDQKGFYHCFSSGKHGDIFRFVMETEGLSFPEAVERLASEAGVEMPAPDPEYRAREQRRSSLYDVMELAAAFFEDRLQTSDGAKARGYLQDRGVEPNVQKVFRIGTAPSSKYELKQFLTSHNISQDQMIAAGLLIAGEDISVPYDRFRDRLMFPISDQRGRVIAFGGRALSPEARAKYLNSPETELFHKGAVLFNWAQAREAAHKQGEIIAVEGYMDVIALYAAGFSHAVAPLGTALTEDQIQLLWRAVPEPILCFDGDKAGLKAAFRAVDTGLGLLKPGFSLKFALLPGGQDPDDLIRDEGGEAMADVLKSAKPLVDMLWMREVEGGDWSTPERRAGLETRIDGLIKEIKDQKIRHHYETALRERLRAFWRQQASGGRSQDKYASVQPYKGRGGEYRQTGNWQQRRGHQAPTQSLRTSSLAQSSGAKNIRRELLLLQTVLNHPDLLEQYVEEFAEIEFSRSELDKLRNGILEIAARRHPLDKDVLGDDLKTKALGPIVDGVANGLGVSKEWFSEPQAAKIDAQTGWLHVLALHRKSLTLQKELKAAERALALEQSQENFEIMQDVQRQLESVEGTEAVVEGFGEASDRYTGTDF